MAICESLEKGGGERELRCGRRGERMSRRSCLSTAERSYCMVIHVQCNINWLYLLCTKDSTHSSIYYYFKKHLRYLIICKYIYIRHRNIYEYSLEGRWMGQRGFEGGGLLDYRPAISINDGCQRSVLCHIKQRVLKVDKTANVIVPTAQRVTFNQCSPSEF